jgi:hypothetical protein
LILYKEKSKNDDPFLKKVQAKLLMKLTSNKKAHKKL